MTPRFDVAHIREHLKHALKHGARAEHLVEHAPDFIDYLCPATSYPGWSCDDRAFHLQRMIAQAADDIGGQLGHAAHILYGLRPGTDVPVEQRRQHAAALVEVEPETFRKHYQQHVINDLSYRLYEHLTPYTTLRARDEGQAQAA